MMEQNKDACEVSHTDAKRVGDMTRHRLFVETRPRFTGVVKLAFTDGQLDGSECKQEHWIKVNM